MLFHDLQERAALQDLAEQGSESIEALESGESCVELQLCEVDDARWTIATRPG